MLKMYEVMPFIHGHKMLFYEFYLKLKMEIFAMIQTFLLKVKVNLTN